MNEDLVAAFDAIGISLRRGSSLGLWVVRRGPRLRVAKIELRVSSRINQDSITGGADEEWHRCVRITRIRAGIGVYPHRLLFSALRKGHELQAQAVDFRIRL